jgi:hypothetical protein
VQTLADPVGQPNVRRRRPRAWPPAARTAAAVIATVVLVLLAAACSDGPSSTSSSASARSPCSFGAIGAGNVMLISVLERRSEIGLRQALGATKGHIRIRAWRISSRSVDRSFFPLHRDINGRVKIVATAAQRVCDSPGHRDVYLSTAQPSVIR